ncbi:hypothetical protein [Ekhidna sp.]
MNYGKYFVEGSRDLDDLEDYSSHNTQRLDVDEIKTTLLKLKIIQDALNG